MATKDGADDEGLGLYVKALQAYRATVASVAEDADCADRLSAVCKWLAANAEEFLKFDLEAVGQCYLKAIEEHGEENESKEALRIKNVLKHRKESEFICDEILCLSERTKQLKEMLSAAVNKFAAHGAKTKPKFHWGYGPAAFDGLCSTMHKKVVTECDKLDCSKIEVYIDLVK